MEESSESREEIENKVNTNEETPQDETQEVVAQEKTKEEEIIEKPKPKAKAKAKAKTVKITKEELVEVVKEATAPPPTPEEPKKIDKNKVKVQCPDCNLEISQHNLKYTHKKYCKAVKKQEENNTPIIPEPPGLIRQTAAPTNIQIEEYIQQNPQCITNYLQTQKAVLRNKKQTMAKSLLSSAF